MIAHITRMESGAGGKTSNEINSSVRARPVRCGWFCEDMRDADIDGMDGGGISVCGGL